MRPGLTEDRGSVLVEDEAVLDEAGGEAGGCGVVAGLGGAAQVGAPVGAVLGQRVRVVAGELGVPLLTPTGGQLIVVVVAAADDGGFVEQGAVQVVQEQPRLVQRLGPTGVVQGAVGVAGSVGRLTPIEYETFIQATHAA